MIFATPELDGDDRRVIAEIERVRHELSRYVAGRPRRWFGYLRRTSFARNVRGSNWIEGYRASLDEVLDTIENEEAVDVSSETQAALTGYQDALTYVLQLAERPRAIDETLLQSLHFMMTKHDLGVSPGGYRQGDVWVADETGYHVYDAPPAEQIEELMADLIVAVNADDGSPTMVRAAMAHLNLAMIRPFRDGNGRMARALPTLVLAREGIVSPIFSSIEEYLGANTLDYYRVLSEVGGGTWQPARSAKPWIRFSLTAHYRQAWTVQRRVHETEHLYDCVEQLVGDHVLPPRSVGALVDASRGRRLRRSSYSHLVELTDGDPISDLTASRDLKALVDADILQPRGQGRGRSYHASDELRRCWLDVRATRPPRPTEDPYVTSQ